MIFWIRFDHDTGALLGYSRGGVDYGEASPPLGGFAYDVEEDIGRALWRAAESGRFTYDAGVVRLDGVNIDTILAALARPPAITYSDAMQGIIGSSLPTQVKSFLGATAKMLLSEGYIEL